MKETLLDLDRVPTLEELRAFFKENDFSAAQIIDIDLKNMDQKTVQKLEDIKSIINSHWEPISREMGLKAPSAYYGKDNPLIQMRDSMQNLIAGGVIKLMDEQPEKADELIESFNRDRSPNMSDDEYVHAAVKKLLEVADYEQLAKVIQGTPMYEDFNHLKRNNYRATDQNRKYNHTRAKTKTVSSDEIEDMNQQYAKPGTGNAEDEALLKMDVKNFWDRLSDEEKNLIQLRMSGCTEEQIAERFGLKTHSAINKRLEKLKEKFLDSAS